MADDTTDDAVRKDTEDWKTADDPMTPAQKSHLESLAQQLGEEVRTENLSKAEASEKIDELRDKADLD